MKITALKTLRLESFPNVCFVLVETDEGLTGLGETFFGARAVAAWVHESAAPYLLGRNPLDVELHATALRSFVGFSGTGAENRGRSAVDIALWDLLGKSCGMPLYRLLGGRLRESVKMYNTCAGPSYTRGQPDSPNLPTSNWGNDAEPALGYNDLQATLTDAGELAKDLLAEGITAMKIWPFDRFAEASGGHHISPRELREGLEPFAKVRDAVGDEMDLIVELHSKWDLPNAMRIARALEEFSPLWFEDPLRMDSMDALAVFSGATPVPTAASETLGSLGELRGAVDRGGARVVLFDPTWVGGVTDAKKIIGFADDCHLPVGPHDCTGPINFSVGVHLSVSAPNAFLQEGVRAFYRGWYQELVSELPSIENGYVKPLEAPGIGTDLRAEVFTRSDAIIEVSESR